MYKRQVYNLRKSACVLCILNTKKSVQRVYQKLEGEGVYHLSTAMYSIHRKRILAEIKERLKKHQKCVVISTSLVEAGVDLDFAAVYRQVAGADSIIQAAGRCNREGKRDYADSVTYVFRLTEREYMPGPVSYTHLDVYKRQVLSLLTFHFQLNQLLMLINNPMMFPHLAYVKMFDDNCFQEEGKE